MNGLSLCSGVGGLELGLRIALRDYRTACYVERETYAAAALVARMEDKIMDQSPVWDNLETFDGEPWSGIVDIITAGYPCQPFSFAGKGCGETDERYIWPDIARIIGEIRPSLVLLENVPGHLIRGFDRTLADLAALGFNAEWDRFRAFDVHAPQIRERLFCLAYSSSKRLAEHEVLNRFGGEDEGNEAESLLLSHWPPGPSNESDIPREVERPPFCNDRLRACGNAVVPVVAALAFTTLWERLRS